MIMKYIINNEKIIKSKRDREIALRVINKQVERLGRIADNYPKPLTTEIYINKYNKLTYLISATIKLKEGVVYVKEKGSDIATVLYILFNKLRLALNKKINKERKEYLHKQKGKRFETLHEYMDDLRQYKKENSKILFTNLLKILLTDVERYVRRRTRSAELTTALKKGKLNIHDILDELYLLAYMRVDEVSGDKNKINAWLYQLADEILDKQLKELDFESEHFAEISEIVEKEINMLNEEFTIDADEEIIPIEELDGFDKQVDMYHAGDLLYVEDENSFLDDLTYRYNKKHIHKLIEKELLKYPVYKRNIMDLYLLHQMNTDDIAEIKQMSVVEIEAVINEVSREVKDKLSFLI